MTALIKPMNRRALSQLTLAMAIAAMTSFTASAGERTRTRGSTGSQDQDHPRGYVDGSEFAKLADENMTLVQVSIGSSLLKPLAKGLAKGDEKLGQLLAGIDSVQAVIVENKEADGGVARAAEMIRETSKRLTDDGWEVLARVRDNGDIVNVFILNVDGEVLGLTALIADRTSMVFANLAGRLDLEMVGEIGAKLQFAGLEDLANVDWSQFEGAIQKSGKGHEKK